MKKKILILTGLLCIVLTGINAQDYEKPVVFIDYFSRPENISSEYAEALRSKVIEGIQNTGRVRLVDVASDSKLNSEEERRKAESAMSDATARTAQMNTLGANYIITGEIVSMEATKKINEKDNTVSYNGNVQWSIKVINAATGTLENTETFKHTTGGFLSSSSDTQLKAIVSACNSAKLEMDNLVELVFPLVGNVLKVETANKKGDKAETVIIDLGKSHGVTKGQRFMVFIEIDIAGEVGHKEVGSLSANEVLSAGRSICKVGKGHAEILKAMNAGQTVKIQTRKNKLLEF